MMHYPLVVGGALLVIVIGHFWGKARLKKILPLKKPKSTNLLS